MTNAPTTSPFDPRPLTGPVNGTDVRAYIARLKADGRYPGRAGAVQYVLGGLFLLVFLFVGVTMAGTFIGAGLDAGGAIGIMFVIVPLLLLAGVVAAVVAWAVRLSGGGASARWYRLDRFARANGLSFLPRVDDPGLPGMIFDKGRDRHATDAVRGEHPRFVEFANYRYTTGDGKESTVHRWGYIAIRLDTPLPNIVLDAKSNNGLFGSNLPESFRGTQRLRLEGDFDEHFALYCPAGYERDALYLFTPDIMARFVDHAAALDAEIVDDWLFLYAQRDLSTLDPATWAWLFSVVGALLDKLGQWARWRDERLAEDAAASARAMSSAAAMAAGAQTPQGVTAPAGPHGHPFVAPAAMLRPPPGVAAAGRRLRQRVPVLGFVIMAAFVAFWLWSTFGGHL